MQNIILLHGALGSSKDFEPLKKVLSKYPLTIHTISFSGHGENNLREGFGIPQFAEEVQGYITKNKIKNPHVFGFSMGGYVALYLAGNQPGLLNKIITLGTKFEWNEEVIDKQRKFLDPELIEKNPALAAQLKSVHGAKLNDLLKNTENMLYDIARENYLNEGFLSKIQNKVLLGIADKDQMVTLNETTNVYKNLTFSNMYMLPRSKHPIETANFELLGNIIEDFIFKS